jgi:hypothetical protein
MKTRQGFVSNSSSTSFAIMGIYADGELNDKIRDIEVSDGFGELKVVYGQDGSDSMYVGLSIDKMRDDETKSQFQARVLVEVQKYLPEIGLADVGFLYDGWYAG